MNGWKPFTPKTVNSRPIRIRAMVAGRFPFFFEVCALLFAIMVSPLLVQSVSQRLYHSDFSQESGKLIESSGPALPHAVASGLERLALRVGRRKGNPPQRKRGPVFVRGQRQ